MKNIDKFYTLSSGLFAKPARLHASQELSFDVAAGETIGIVGERLRQIDRRARASGLTRLRRPGAVSRRDVLKIGAKQLLAFAGRCRWCSRTPTVR